MKRLAVAVAALIVPSALPAQEVDAASAYRRAVEARLSGDPAEAARLLEPLVAANPNDADARVQLGYAYLGLKRAEDAARVFTEALVIAPEYSDARLGRARAALQLGDRAGALRELDLLQPEDPEMARLRGQIEAASRSTKWTIDFDASYAELEGDQPDWNEAALQLRYQPGEASALAARVERSTRFGVTDIHVQGLAEQAVGRRVRVYALLGATSDADFRASWLVGFGGSMRVSNGDNPTVLTLDLRHSAFATGDVRTVNLGIDQYVLDGRAWLTARMINSFDSNGHRLSGYILRGDVTPAPNLRVFAGYANAPDTSEGAIVDTRSYFGGVSADIASRITVRLSVAQENSASAADRTQFNLGLGWRL